MMGPPHSPSFERALHQIRFILAYMAVLATVALIRSPLL
jgi:hypothetical protein